ncbi:hypothetical protein PGT21_031752 [Puccinia graminis f. sp. tritici]|uniref:Uncharacterized protein n=1 Tax=Puccinia graminis f. sp. tritici TaxID=56615 RepID=A0A5B0S2X3_PUCGR|nr:hypothetical protein PGT21_031752 [Puccinia graminis f. sp. tritici]KAA1131393.1 hypothetical protein PGTUg99_033542 [Puccinia graminis f. sp. tritici]
MKPSGNTKLILPIVEDHPSRSLESSAASSPGITLEVTPVLDQVLTQRVELGATGSYTVRPPRPRYELHGTGAMFPAKKLGRTIPRPWGCQPRHGDAPADRHLAALLTGAPPMGPRAAF